MTFAASPPSKEPVTGTAHLRAVERAVLELPTLDEGDNLAQPRRVRRRRETPGLVNGTPRSVRKRRRLRVTVGVVAAGSILFAGCSSPGERETVTAPQAESLNTIEINDQRVALPTTRLVLCTRPPAAPPLFFWTGSNVLTPRRPLSDQESDRVEVRFDDTTLTLKALTLLMYHRGKQISARWPDASGSAGFATLTSPGPRRYVVAADVAQSDSGRRLSLLIEFRC